MKLRKTKEEKVADDILAEICVKKRKLQMAYKEPKIIIIDEDYWNCLVRQNKSLATRLDFGDRIEFAIIGLRAFILPSNRLREETKKDWIII